MTDEPERQWTNRRRIEADAAGITAAKARQVMVAAMDAGDDKMTKAAAYAYGVLVEKAQYLAHLSAGVEDDGLDDFLSIVGVSTPVRDPEDTGAGDARPGGSGGGPPPR